VTEVEQACGGSSFQPRQDVGHDVADDDVIARTHRHQTARGGHGARDRARTAQPSADLLGDPRPVTMKRHRGGDVFELLLVAAGGHMKGDVVAFGDQLVRGVDHQPLRPADSEPRAQERDP